GLTWAGRSRISSRGAGLHLLAAAAGLSEAGRPQLATGGAVAELGSSLGAVARSEDVPQIGLVLERIRVLGRVAAQAHAARRLEPNVGAARILHVQAPGPVALLALHR